MIRLMDKKLIVISPRMAANVRVGDPLARARGQAQKRPSLGGIARVISDAGLQDQAYLDGQTENAAGFLNVAGRRRLLP